MKKILLLMFCFALVTCAFGAYQLPGITSYTYGHNYHGHRFNYLTVEQTGNITFDFDNHISSITDWSSLLVNIVSADNQILSTQAFNITGGRVNVGTLTAGTNFTLELVNGTKHTTFNGFWGLGWDVPQHEYEYIGFDGNYGKHNHGYTQQYFKIESSTILHGTPLPKSATTILIGLFAIGGCSMLAFRHAKKDGGR